MDLYASVSYDLSKKLTLSYSTSFGMSSRLFDKTLRPHIYAIYGLVRIADEIVDTYKGDNQLKLLSNLESQTLEAIQSGYSHNPIVHSFAITARAYGIDKDLIEPFFDSMKIDAGHPEYKQTMYKKYIYGSAEVVGLMCLRVFVDNNQHQYDQLKNGAASLGAAYQKVNFLRDIRYDYEQLGRVYFPGVDYKSFNDEQKSLIVQDIKKDFEDARQSIKKLPGSAKPAVAASFIYYSLLLQKLNESQADKIKLKRFSVPRWRKLAVFIKVFITRGSIL